MLPDGAPASCSCCVPLQNTKIARPYFCRLRELDDDEETLGNAFSLNDAWVQFELPGDVDDNGVSSSTLSSSPEPRLNALIFFAYVFSKC